MLENFSHREFGTVIFKKSDASPQMAILGSPEYGVPESPGRLPNAQLCQESSHTPPAFLLMVEAPDTPLIERT
jgi:hypothetical protein